MKNAFCFVRFFMFLFVVLLLSNFSASAQKTTIWVVRHAEKLNTAQGDDPALSAEGLQRAKDLAKTLKHKKIKAIYVTRYKRTGQTAKPLADEQRILPRVYTDSIKQYANTIVKNFKGNNVLIIGHSNTIMPLLAALGAEQPFETLADDDYDMLFKVTVNDSGRVDLDITYYGKAHHSTEMPVKYQLNVEAQQFTRPINSY